MLGFVHGVEMAMYPDRKDSRRGGRVAYEGSKELARQISKHEFLNAIEEVCTSYPGYPLSDGVADMIMDKLNLTPSQSGLAKEPYMIEISACDGQVGADVGNGELIHKGVQIIYLAGCQFFYTERTSSIGRQLLRECPVHSRCHVEAHVPGDAGIGFLVGVERIK